MQKLPSIAFVADDGDIRVNFGMYAGREATQAEIDDLARTLLEEVQAVTIVAEQRYLVDRETEAAVHQIRIQQEGGDARGQPHRLEQLEGRAQRAARLGPRLRVLGGGYQRQVAPAVHDQRGPNRLPGEPGARPARQHRHACLRCRLHNRAQVIGHAGKRHPHWHDLVK